jgi:1,4-dihydroxy-2-naphthoate octaprenyltransferase
MGILTGYSLLTWASVPMAIRSTRLVFTARGRSLNAALAGTGQVALLFSILFWVGLSFS